jgi:prolyl-tRNA synthetase
MMGDGKALQMGTSHELGQNFAHAFDITYLSEDNQRELCWTTSWGTSTRMVGGLIMAHGDDDGLRVPPRIAPIQVLVMVVKEGDGVGDAARRVVADLTDAGVRAELDDRDSAFGRRAIDAEIKGIPVRVEIGPRDLAEGAVTVARRIAGGKTSVPLQALTQTVIAALDADHQSLYAEALARRKSRTVAARTIEEAAEGARTGWATIPWRDLGTAGEATLAESAISVRCLVLPDGTVPQSDDEDDVMAVVARAY